VPHIRGLVVGVGAGWRRWAQVNLQTQWDQLCAKEAVNGLQTTLQGKTGHPITVMDYYCREQFHTNATLLIKACQALPQSYESSTGL